MAVYKVAQDVEAEDKLIGPFSFRQFVYLIIVAIAGALAWGLSRLFLPLAIIPLPIILFFGALALPLRKDQPMEIYLAAILSYYLKPRKRRWIPDGIEHLVEITAPIEIEVQRTKDLTQTEAERRLSYLADIADTGGWSVRRAAAAPQESNAMISDVYYEAQQTEDVLDASGHVAQSFNNMIEQADMRRRQEIVERMHQAPALATPTEAPVGSVPQPQPYVTPAQQPMSAPQPETPSAITFNPYPTSMHQSVIQPGGAPPVVVSASQGVTPLNVPTPSAPQVPQNPVQEVRPSTSEKVVSPDIINLANNSDLSIETIQREADRLQKKHEDDGEVFISLR